MTHRPGSVAEEIMEEGRMRQAERTAGMSEEQLMKLRKSIESAKERGDWERVRELGRTHYEQTGAGGGS